MLDNFLYDTSGFSRHGLNIAMVDKKQILFVPVLQSRLISEAAVIFDCPMDAYEIGRLFFCFFEQMRQRNLTLNTPYNDYWFLPKGIRSYKKYVEAALSVTLEWDGDVLGCYRWFPAPDRGFTVEGTGSCNATISTAVSAKELGRFVLQQFDYIEKKRQQS